MNDFNEYLDYSTEEDKAKQLRIMDKILLSEGAKEKIKSIDKKISFMIFAEPYCPDCRAFVPFMEKFAELNPLIHVTYLSRKDNLELLASLSKEARIPSMFAYINGKGRLVYLELPNFVWQRIKDGEDQSELRYNYRTGVYNKELEEELLEIILKTEKENVQP
jgi:thiol-disulfide isomerase/thioredoxin